MQRVHSLDTLWVQNFDEIALSRTVKEIEGNLCFAIFGKNSKIQNGRHFWGGENFLKIAKSTFLRYPVGRKFRRLRRWKQICVLPFLPKIQNGRHFWGGEIFLKIAKITLQKLHVQWGGHNDVLKDINDWLTGRQSRQTGIC